MNPSRKNQDIPPIILPNGDTQLCCKDWSMDYTLGNLLNCEYEELFQSKTFKEIFRKMNSESILLVNIRRHRTGGEVLCVCEVKFWE